MNTLSITKENALKCYQEASGEVKTAILNLVGKEHLLNITERIKSYQDACEHQGITPLNVGYFSFLPEIDRVHAFAAHKVVTIIRSLNEGWVPDWSDDDQSKYYVWYKNSGAGFSCSVYGYDCAYSDVGSRLHFKTLELAQYFGKNFTTEINEYFNI
ncbi:MAG: hypothetical protein J7577_00975 [Sphingobacteriaceae bacterium]|nr:hypothetical protein [Sphingobacteriaceae bacterium]